MCRGAFDPVSYTHLDVYKRQNESLYKLDFETRGVLFHELVHAYQFEPKGIGSYSTNKTFWACIEGLADAVRAQAGYFDMSTRKPGGNWMDGYRTTGFFIQWLTTKDPDAIRKFHETVRDLDEWSFDKAMKRMFGDDASTVSYTHLDVYKRQPLTPSDFIKDYRMMHAARLLVTTNLSVQEIIYQVGISNKSYFYREFSAKYGVTPGEYRRMQ